jgi:hypothetical protein
VRGNAEKSYELCAGAANHITTIGERIFFLAVCHSLTGCAKATLYSETYTLKHCAVFLCYYIFTASIMHVTSREYLSLDFRHPSRLTPAVGSFIIPHRPAGPLGPHKMYGRSQGDGDRLARRRARA